MPDDEIDPMISGVASLIIPGLGQALLNDQVTRGIVAFVAVGVVDFILFVLGIFLFFVPWLLIPIVHIGVAYDAYNQAQKINAGEITVQ